VGAPPLLRAHCVLLLTVFCVHSRRTLVRPTAECWLCSLLLHTFAEESLLISRASFPSIFAPPKKPTSPFRFGRGQIPLLVVYTTPALLMTHSGSGCSRICPMSGATSVYLCHGRTSFLPRSAVTSAYSLVFPLRHVSDLPSPFPAFPTKFILLDRLFPSITPPLKWPPLSYYCSKEPSIFPLLFLKLFPPLTSQLLLKPLMLL